MSELLEGRTALVTGGTSGIGRGIAEVLRMRGAAVAVTGATEARCEDARAAGFPAYRLDVRDRQACNEAVARAVSDLGGLSVLASNAGVYPQTRISDMADEDIAAIFGVNVTGTIHMVQAATPALRESGRGRVVVTSSITGNVTGYPGWSHYGATKAAQMGFVRSAAMELAKDGITINAVMPGNVLSEGLQAQGETYLAQMRAAIPTHTLGTPADIGYAACFLASREAGYVTGQGIIVDGGQILPESADALL